MPCKYLKIRQKKYRKFGYCIQQKKEVPLFCKNCVDYRIETPLVQKKRSTSYANIKIQNKSKKLSKLERNRYSIVYSDLNKCCVRDCTTPYYYVQKNEVFEGAYRQASMKLGMVAPFCSRCHQRFHHDREFNLKYKTKFQEAYMMNHSLEEFIDIFKKDYIYLYNQYLQK